MNINKLSSLVAACMILASSNVLAADNKAALSEIKGEVLVNQGESYVSAQEGMLLNAGDQLMVMEGGKARIEYADGCLHKLNGNELLRISEQSTCVSNVAKQTGPQYTQLGGPQNNGGALAVGVAGVAGLIAVLTKDDKNNNITGTGNN